MYSQQGDIVLDPFFGLGTTTMAAMVTGRNSIGFEIDEKLLSSIQANINSIDLISSNKIVDDRYNKHLKFISERESLGNVVKYYNDFLQCKVMTKQEIEMHLHYLSSLVNVNENPLVYQCEYKTFNF